MNGAEIANNIAKALIAEKKARLNVRLDEVAKEKKLSILEKAQLRSRAMEAMDRGDLVI